VDAFPFFLDDSYFFFEVNMMILLLNSFFITRNSWSSTRTRKRWSIFIKCFLAPLTWRQHAWHSIMWSSSITHGKQLIIGLRRRVIERFWDTANIFHLPFGEMMIIPTDL